MCFSDVLKHSLPSNDILICFLNSGKCNSFYQTNKQKVLIEKIFLSIEIDLSLVICFFSYVTILLAEFNYPIVLCREGTLILLYVKWDNGVQMT